MYGGNTFNNIPTTGPTSTGADAGLNLPSSGTGTIGPSGLGFEDGGPYGTAGNTPSSYPASPATNPSESLAYGTGTANPGADSQFGADDLWADSAGESFYNTSTHAVSSVNSEPTGPNSPLVTNSNGYQLYYGPGFNLDINRPPACTVSSTATSGTTTSLTDTAQSWMSNEYVGSKMTITGGTGSGESATITGNNSNTLSFAALATAPDSTSSYTITGNGLVTGANCVAGEVLGDGGTTSSATRKDSTGVTSSGSSVTDNSIVADDTGREVVAATVGGASITAPGTTAYDDAFQVGGVDAVVHRCRLRR